MKYFWKYNPRYIQYMATIVANLMMAAVGTHLAWASPVLSKLVTDDSIFGTQLTQDQGSWIVSMYFLGGTVGFLPAYWIVKNFGRKPSLLLSSIPMGGAWIVIALTKSIPVLYICRFVAGMGASLATFVCPIYIGEIADKDIRGKLGAILAVLKFSGSLYVLSVGPFASYNVLSLTCCVIPIASSVLFYFIPESPYYFITINEREKAKTSLNALSGNNDDTKLESRLKEIESIVSYDMRNKSTLWEFVSKTDYRKSLTIIIGVNTLQAFSGMFTITSYIQPIIEVSHSNISPEISSMIIGAAQIISALFSTLLIERLGRRKLLITSALGTAIASAGVAIYFYLQDRTDADVNCLGWLPTSSLLLYFLSSTMGIYALPYVLLGEIFATNVKVVAIAIAQTFLIGSSFGITKLFQPLSNEWGMDVVFSIFTLSCVLGSVFVYCVLPETKGKTFEEIQMKLNPSRRAETNRRDNDFM